MRFFDRTYRFAEPDISAFVRALFAEFQIDDRILSAPDGQNPAKFVASVAEAYSLTPREIKRAFDVLRSAITIWPHPVPIELLLLLPAVVAQCRGDVGTLTSLSKLTGFKLPPRAGEVVIEFEKYRDREGRAERVSLAQLFEAFMSFVVTPLSDVSDRERGRGYREWMAERFTKEFRIMHGNRRTSKSEPRSVCRDYVELVRAVGRLSPNSGESQPG